jgi:hypothetical protein
MPIDEYVARDFLAWYDISPYKSPSDYVWATDANRAGGKARETAGVVGHSDEGSHTTDGECWGSRRKSFSSYCGTQRRE